jgi:lipopolysaccharide export system permease protein
MRGGTIFKVIDRHVFWRVLGVMLATIMVGILMLSMVRMLLVLQSGSDLGQALILVVRLTLLFIPHYLGFMLPFALFWGTYVVVRRLSLNSELVSLFANKMSLARFILPLFILGIFVTGINAGVLGWLEPFSRYSYRELMFQLKHVTPYLAVREGVFTRIGRQTIFVERIDKQTNTFKKILFFELGEDGTQTEIIASQGEVFFGGSLPVLLLRDGNRLVMQKNPLAQAGQPDVPDNLEFQTLTFPLAPPSVQFHSQGDDEQEFSLYGLFERLNTPPPGTTVAEMESELNRKLIIILTSLFLPLLAAFCAQANPRGSNLHQGILSFGIVILYQQLIQFGSVLTDRTGLTPIVTMWPLFGILAAGSVILIALQDNGVGSPIDRVMRALRNTGRQARGLLPFSAKSRADTLL